MGPQCCFLSSRLGAQARRHIRSFGYPTCCKTPSSEGGLMLCCRFAKNVESSSKDPATTCPLSAGRSPSSPGPLVSCKQILLAQLLLLKPSCSSPHSSNLHSSRAGDFLDASP